MKKFNVDWAQAALVRAVRTVAQTALSMFTVGAAFNELDWVLIGSISGVAGVYSLLTSVATSLPEVATDGVMKINTSNPKKDTYLLEVGDDISKLGTKKNIRFKVETDGGKTPVKVKVEEKKDPQE